MKHYIRAVVRDKNGKVIKDTGYKRVNTITRWFYALLATDMAQEARWQITFENGTTGTLGYDSRNFGAAAGEGDTGRHIVVGTGTADPTRLDHALEAKIAHGTGSGQLYYGVGSFDIGDDYIELRRTFTNNSGADITINEIGILVYAYDADAGTLKRALIARSLYTITVPDGGSVTLYYRISG